MSVASLSFISFILIGALFFYITPNLIWRRWVLLGLSGSFLIMVVGSPLKLWPTLFFGLTALNLIILSLKKIKLFVPWVIGMLVALFLLIKGYLPLPLPTSFLETVGISYILFRSIQILTDINDETITKKSIKTFDIVLFLFSFLTILAGPIQHFQNFRTQLDSIHLIKFKECDIAAIISRTTAGFLKLLLLAPFIKLTFNELLELDNIILRYGLCSSIFMFWIYINFSGYMDIIISSGRLFGFSLPENFDRPDRSINFLDIWSRWHITLSRTLLAYVFNPFVRKILKNFPKKIILAGILGYFLIFFLIGWWHGSSSQFILSGILLGLSASLTKVFQIIMQQRLFFIKYFKFNSIFSGGIGLGMCAVAFMPTWSIFLSAQDVLSAFHSPLHFLGILSVAFGVGLLVRLLSTISDRLFQIKSIAKIFEKFIQNPVTIGIIIIIIFAEVINSQDAISPIVYYQKF